jgi:hypothetical protein
MLPLIVGIVTLRARKVKKQECSAMVSFFPYAQGNNGNNNVVRFDRTYRHPHGHD